MGRLLVVAVWLVACAGRAAAGNTVADIADVPGSGWTRLWRDEFRPRRGGLSKWDMEVGTGCQYYSNPVDKYPLCGWGNNELEYYTPQNAEIKNGQLVIEARKEVTGLLTSARLRQKGPGFMPTDQWPVIRVSARIMLPYGSGLWPALWMLPATSQYCSGCGSYGTWAASGEIDIMEAANGMDQVTSAIHFGGTFPANTFLNAAKQANPANPFANHWHVYSLEWERTEMRWYVDGELYHTRRSGNGNPSAGGWFSTGAGAGPNSPFDKPFVILINLALGGGYTGNVPAEHVAQTLSTPKQLRVDWVRVYGRAN